MNSANRVRVGDIVTRYPITFTDKERKKVSPIQGRVIWVHPLNRFHVAEFSKGQRVVRESFMGVAR